MRVNTTQNERPFVAHEPIRLMYTHLLPVVHACCTSLVVDGHEHRILRTYARTHTSLSFRATTTKKGGWDGLNKFTSGRSRTVSVVHACGVINVSVMPPYGTLLGVDGFFLEFIIFDD